MKYDPAIHARLAELCAHKRIFEGGAVSYLKKVFPGVGIISTYDAADIVTPCIAVDFEPGAAQGKTVKTALTGWHEDYIFAGSLSVQYMSRRDSSSAEHFDFVTRLRAAFAAGFAMDSDNLPLSPLALAAISFAGEASAYDESLKADVTALSFDAEYIIAPEFFEAEQKPSV